MKKYVTVLLSLTILMSALVPFAAQTAPGTPAEDDTLNNDSVIKMLKDGLPAEIVVAKIKSSRGTFDTSPAALSTLKQSGVPDAVMLAMVEVSGLPRNPTLAAAAVEVKVLDGQELEVELMRVASGEDLKVGDIVDFSVTQPVIVNGVTIIEKGASARAHITTAKRAGHWGKAGKLEWAMKDVLTVDGNRIPVRFTQRAIGDSKGGTVAVAAVATTVLLGPLGLLWGLKKGKPAIIPAGNRYPVFVHGDSTVKGNPVKG